MTMILETKCLILREMDHDDYDALYQPKRMGGTT